MNTPVTVVIPGRVTADLKLQTSANGNNTHYVQFSLAVNKGLGDKEHANFYQCILYHQAAERIVNAKVKKGSLIYVTGDLDLTEFTRRDGTPGFAARVTVLDWSYLPSNRFKNGAEAGTDTGEDAENNDDFVPFDCGQNGLPY